MDQDERRFELFATLLAVAMLFQLASVVWFAMQLRELQAGGFVELAQLLVCLLIVKRPTPRLLLAVAVVQLWGFWLSLPHIPNHRLVTAMVSVSVLLSALTGARTAGDYFRSLAPVCRTCVIVVYFFAVFHKLNPAFLDPQTSCTTPFFRHILAIFPVVSDRPLLLSALPYMTLLIEGLIPLLLLRSSTRHIGLILAFFFHSTLTLDVEKHFFDFTATMFALLSAYLPPEFLSTLLRRTTERRFLSLEAWRFVFLVWFTIVMAAMLFYTTPSAFTVYYAGRQCLWWILNALFAYLLFLGLRGVSAKPVHFVPPSKLLFVAPLLLIGNGICPYLGIKTRSALDMYSNLRVEGDSPNHYLIRRPADLLGNINDLVKITASSDQTLINEYITPGLLITYFEFRRYTSLHPSISVSYERNGTSREVPFVADDPELRTRWPLIYEKLLWYRPIDPNQQARCQW